MIRHAGLCVPLPLSILTLSVAMVQPAFFALLMAFIGGSHLPEARLLAALFAAIAMAPITMRADEEDAVAMLAATRPLQEHSLAMSRR